MIWQFSSWKSARALVQRATGARTFLEVGPGSALLGLGRQSVGDGGEWLPSLSRQKSDWQVMTQSLRALYVGGHDIDWAAFDAPYPRRRVSLPTYAFERKRYWVKESRARATATGAADAHPLLGQRLRSTLNMRCTLSRGLRPVHCMCVWHCIPV